MTRQQLFAAFFFAVFLYLLFQFYRMFYVFLVPLTWAALLALAFSPLHIRLTRALHGRDSLASFLFTTVVILVVMVPTVLLTILLANESVALYERSRDFFTSGDLEHFLERVRDPPCNGIGPTSRPFSRNGTWTSERSSQPAPTP